MTRRIDSKAGLRRLADELRDWRGVTVRVEGDRVDRDIMAAQLILTGPSGNDLAEINVHDLLTWATGAGDVTAPPLL